MFEYNPDEITAKSGYNQSMRWRSAFLLACGLAILPRLAGASLTPLSVTDELFKKRQVPEFAESALSQYRIAFQENHTAETGWRLAMADYFVGLRLRTDEDKKRVLFQEGIDVGRAALELKPDCAACHFWTAINMALYGQSVGPFKMLFSLNEIREHLKKSLELDPTYAYGGAYRLQGMIEWKLPGILGGSNDRAEANFKHAIETAPDEPLNYLFMARLLLNLGRGPEAKTWIDKGLAQPQPAPDRVESAEAIGDLKALLADKRLI
jgi:tetratricopeptide (TPR) repeat protein